MALGAIARKYPNKPEHYMVTAADVKGPRALHPAFFGALDWHSSVHGHWTLVRLLRWFPDLPEQKAIRAILGEHLTAKNIQIEADYFTQPGRQTFERMYGWAWLLKLAEELTAGTTRTAGNGPNTSNRWPARSSPNTWPFCPSRRIPSAPGLHSNTAFGFLFA